MEAECGKNSQVFLDFFAMIFPITKQITLNCEKKNEENLAIFMPLRLH